MIKYFVKTVCQAIANLFNKFLHKKALTNTEENVQTPIKDKLLFQPNTIQANNPLECLIHSKKQTSIEIPIKQSDNEECKITIECNETAINHLNNLCRFFEVNQTDALARGVWLLTIARDVEISNKKLGIITTDQNGLIIDVMPINIV